MGSGAFGAFLTLVFQEDQAAFRFESNAVADGRSLLEYSFQVRREDSHYKVKLKDGSWVFTAYSGRFRVDPETEDVVRMSVETAELPAASNQCIIETAMELGIRRIAGASVPLPAHTRQRFVYGDGEETENTTTFANCHEYRGESTILYDEEPAGPAPGNTPGETPAAARVPAGLRFTMELTAPISAATAAAGDAFAGKLVWPLLDAKHKVLARAGSVMEGRLLRVHSYYLPEAEVVLALKLESVEIGGSKMPLTATRDFTAEMQEKIRGRRTMPIMTAPSPSRRGARRSVPVRGKERGNRQGVPLGVADAVKTGVGGQGLGGWEEVTQADATAGFSWGGWASKWRRAEATTRSTSSRLNGWARTS